MGKYIKKSKVTTTTTAEVQSPSSTGGVRTRAKTLALQRQQQMNDDVSSSYLQLRSRRLEKPPQPKPSINTKEKNFRKSGGGCFGKLGGNKNDHGDDADVSEFAESNNNNNLDFEGRDRCTRESTPCSLIRDSESIRTPGSTTRTRTPSSAITHRALLRFIPHEEFEEFFAYEDQRQKEQCRLLLEKYNFDFANDTPCPGRYEWQQVNP